MFTLFRKRAEEAKGRCPFLLKIDNPQLLYHNETPMIEKELSYTETGIEQNKHSDFLKENSAQICEGLKIPVDTPFEEVTRLLRKDLYLSPFASSQEIIDAILEDMFKSN